MHCIEIVNIPATGTFKRLVDTSRSLLFPFFPWFEAPERVVVLNFWSVFDLDHFWCNSKKILFASLVNLSKSKRDLSSTDLDGCHINRDVSNNSCYPPHMIEVFSETWLNHCWCSEWIETNHVSNWKAQNAVPWLQTNGHSLLRQSCLKKSSTL